MERRFRVLRAAVNRDAVLVEAVRLALCSGDDNDASCDALEHAAHVPAWLLLDLLPVARTIAEPVERSRA